MSDPKDTEPAEERREYAEVHYKANGSVYVKASEVMKTEKMRRTVERLRQARDRIHGVTEEDHQKPARQE